ncbi:hypothetical protein [Nocardioides sp.]|uniref:hypothetical protein n=1 Tax=Nocardioides sp. TaxID=35761 RepID=UPI001A2A0407|nr:hypothetical protein [Nocardioides sp.]MBJ7358529.1 hypothetical protein [Nocardioides sp.]
MTTEGRSLRLEILPGPGPVQGRLDPGTGPAREFVGWLQLLEVLAEVIDAE